MSELPNVEVIEKINELRDSSFKCLIPTRIRKIGIHYLMSYPRSGEKQGLIFLIKSIKKLHEINIAYWDLFPDNVVDDWLVDNGLMSWSDVRPHKLRLDVVGYIDGITCDKHCLEKNFPVIDDMYYHRYDKYPIIHYIIMLISPIPIMLILLKVFIWDSNSIPIITILSFLLLFVSFARWDIGRRSLHYRFWENAIVDALTYSLLYLIHVVLMRLHSKIYLGKSEINTAMDIYNRL